MRRSDSSRNATASAHNSGASGSLYSRHSPGVDPNSPTRPEFERFVQPRRWPIRQANPEN